jgi:transposase
MAERFVNVDRRTPMLLPVDLREWVAQNDVARLVLELVEQCEVSEAHINVRGSGSAQYPPRLMLALLIYCYSQRIFSSRQIERASYDSVAVRYLCANEHPDHDTIATFRRDNAALLQRCFVHVLLLAREMGVLRLGVVALDGTRLAGAGSRRAVRTHAQIEAELAELSLELAQRAQAADGRDTDGEGTQLPKDLSDAALRQKKLLAAKAVIEARRQEAAQAGRRDRPGSSRQTRVASLSEPESRSLCRRAEPSTVQGYNAQMAADAGPSGLIVGARLSAAASANTELEAGLEAIAPELGEVTTVLVDKGYENTAAIARVEARHRLQVLCPPQRRGNTVEQPRNRRGKEGVIFRLRQQMAARLAQPHLSALYRRRGPAAEGVFARIKNVLGFRRFGCWGLQAAAAEWSLVCLAHNVRILAGRINAGARVAAGAG